MQWKGQNFLGLLDSVENFIFHQLLGRVAGIGALGTWGLEGSCYLTLLPKLKGTLARAGNLEKNHRK